MYRKQAVLALAGALILIQVPLVASALLDPVTQVSRSSDANYTVQDGSFSFVWPAYWFLFERYYESITGSNMNLLALANQAELSNRSTEDIYVLHSTASGIFDLPQSVVSKLSSKDLVNFYIDQQIKNSINPMIINTSITTLNGDQVYSVEWSQLTPARMMFINIDRFVFHKDQVYFLHGDYATINASARSVIIATLDSFKIADAKI